MTHLPDSSKIVAFQKPEDRDAQAFKEYMLEILANIQAKIENDEVQAFSVALELKDFGVYTDFTGGFNPVLIGATSHLLWRLNGVE